MPARSKPFTELSYANEADPPVKRWLIRSVEGLSGRDRFAAFYELWRRTVAPSGEHVFSHMLSLVGIGLNTIGQWPPASLPDGPLVIIANHPFGIGDGIAILSLAERLGRPFRVMIASELLRIPEMEPYALPVDFSGTREALKKNLAIRHEALRLLKGGVTIVVFPAGGVATSPTGFGKAEDLPWKMFPARLVHDAGASVLPVYFSGQNGRLFHLVSRPMHLIEREGLVAATIGKISLTLRLSLLVREFSRLSGKTIEARVGPALCRAELEQLPDRKALLERMKQAVFELEQLPDRKALLERMQHAVFELAPAQPPLRRLATKHPITPGRQSASPSS